MKRFPYILCIVFPVFVWACHTSRQTIGEARENRVHSIDRDLHVVIDSLCRNEWSGLTEWEWTHVDVFDSMQDKTVNPSISITRLKQSKKVVARNETVVSDSLNEAAALQSRSEKEQNHRSSKEMDTHRVSGYVLMIFIIILFFYIIRRKKIRNVENPFEFETVVFSFSEEQILRELIAESSYVAKSLVGQSDLKSGWSRSIIFSEDDKPFLSRWLADARDEMMRSLSAYLSDESVSTETTLVFAVLLSRQRPLALDESICHQLERAIVHHVLNQWFATKQPEESVRRQLQYKGAMSAVKSDIRLGCNRRPHRPTNYF